MQVRMNTFVITEQDRRAIRFVNDGRKTMCSREEAKKWIQAHVDAALADLRYRWAGPAVPESVANGANPEGVASQRAATAASVNSGKGPALAAESVNASDPANDDDGDVVDDSESEKVPANA